MAGGPGTWLARPNVAEINGVTTLPLAMPPSVRQSLSEPIVPHAALK